MQPLEVNADSLMKVAMPSTTLDYTAGKLHKPLVGMLAKTCMQHPHLARVWGSSLPAVYCHADSESAGFDQSK